MRNSDSEGEDNEDGDADKSMDMSYVEDTSFLKVNILTSFYVLVF